GVGDAFVSALEASGTELAFSTYLGGNNDDNAQAVAVDASAVYVAGRTRSPNFPTYLPRQGALAGGPYDAFLTKILVGAAVPAGRPLTWFGLAALLLATALLLAPRRRRV